MEGLTGILDLEFFVYERLTETKDWSDKMVNTRYGPGYI